MFNVQHIIKDVKTLLEERAAKQEVQNLKNLKIQCASQILAGYASAEMSGQEKVELAVELTNELFQNKEKLK